MTKEVIVSIAGLQFQNEDGEAIELISAGNYYCKNGKHYVIYEELVEGKDDNTTSTVKCTLKMSEQQVEVIKKGSTAVHMIFELGQNHLTYYSTPYGELLIGITTNNILVKEEEGQIEVELTYSLDMNYQFVSECNLKIKVRAKEKEA